MLNLHLCVRRSGVLGVEMKTLPVNFVDYSNFVNKTNWAFLLTVKRDTHFVNLVACLT